MPVNRNALIRYKTIDQCLQNRFRRWTLNDLIEACSDALYEYEGIDKGVSRRSVQVDLQIMRSDKLGYNAPIIVVDKKYYTYADANYSITNIPISRQDLNSLQEAVEFLKQFQGFSHFQELGGMVQKLEGHIYAQRMQQRPAIDFERNENLKGLEWLDVLYQAIIKKRVLQLEYQSFRARTSGKFIFHAYLLKEFNNRWFLIGRKEADSILLTLALDRIIQVLILNDTPYLGDAEFDAKEYYKDVIGVTVNQNTRARRTLLLVNKKNTPYILTKPLHHSQKVEEERQDGTVIEIMVKHNFELERLILGFGAGIEVLTPSRLRRKIKEQLRKVYQKYQVEEDT